MGVFFQRNAMRTGQGFRCHSCGYLLATELTGSAYRVVFHCNRCKTRTTMECPAPIPFAADTLPTPTGP